MSSIKFVSVLLFVALASVHCQHGILAIAEIIPGKHGHAAPTKESAQLPKLPETSNSQLSNQNLATLLKSVGIAPKDLLSQNSQKNENLLQLLSHVLHVLLTGLKGIL